MIKIITDYLDEAVNNYPNKVAFVDEIREVTYTQLQIESYQIAYSIIKKKINKLPIAIFVDRSIDCISAMLGIAYSGNFYSVIDVDMPVDRIRKICDVLEPKLIITTSKNIVIAEEFVEKEKILVIDDVLQTEVDINRIRECKNRIFGCDVLYVLFTSGSTGTPKGVVTPHRAVVNYIDSLTTAYQINDSSIFGNQIPFYFVMSVLDIYGTIAKGAKTYIIPKKKFLFPGFLVKYMSENLINTISWVPSALCLIANTNAFKAADLSHIRTVIFGGEVMPIKQLKQWKEVVPDAMFINGYGSTEITDGCTYYIVDREFNDNDTLPIGIPFSNSEIIVLDETDDGVGELCIRSDSMTYGYYKDPDKTSQVFIQNPNNNCYRDIIYRMGDLVRYNEYGELEYIGRKDTQIKHMGRRIELGEIEANIDSIEGVLEVCCEYDEVNQQIVLVYVGTIEENKLSEEIKKKLPEYMCPKRKINISRMPHNMNGKIDRNAIRKMIKES